MDKSQLDFLKELAKVCRKAGISTFKGHGVEFELSELPTTARPTFQTKAPKKKKVMLQTPDGDIETDAPTELELLFWSSGGDKDSQDDDATKVPS